MVWVSAQGEGRGQDNESVAGIGVGVALLLLGSFTLFYNFAWLYFCERLFPQHNVIVPSSPAHAARGRAGGDGGDREGIFDQGTLSLAAAGRAFSVTFALSLCIFELIILEVAGLLNPASSSLAWRACLAIMVVGLHLILPFLLAYACLGEIGLGRRSSCVGALLLLSLVFTFASRLGEYYIDDYNYHVLYEDDAGLAAPPSLLSLEAGLARVGVVGVASLALFSGFGAVNLPYQQIATLFRKVPASLIASRERRARLILADIGQRKRRAAIARATTKTSTAMSGGARGWRGSLDGSDGADGGSRTMSLVAKVVRAVTRLPSTASGDGTSQASQAFFEAETASLEQIAQELFLEIADCRRIQEQQRRAKTLRGRVLVAFGAVMFVYCLLRLWKAAIAAIWVPFLDLSWVPLSEGSAAAGVGVGTVGSGTGDDPATRLVRFALSRHLLVDVDAEGWSELISFVLIGILVLVQTRGILVTMMTVSKASMISGVSIPAQVLSVLLSMLMGTYFTSSVILMRVNLPPRHRVALSSVLGGMRFSFYQRWFDTFFLLSGCVTAVTLLAFHLANRHSDADQLEDTATTAAAKNNVTPASFYAANSSGNKANDHVWWSKKRMTRRDD